MFSISDVPQSENGGDYPVLPAGTYEATVLEAGWCEAKTGAGQMLLKLGIRHHGKKVRVTDWLTHTSATGEPVGPGMRTIAQAAKACNAVTASDEPDPSGMPGNTITVVLSVEEYRGSDRNRIDRIKTPGATPEAYREATQRSNRPPMQRSDPTTVKDEPVSEAPLDDEIPF